MRVYVLVYDYLYWVFLLGHVFVFIVCLYRLRVMYRFRMYASYNVAVSNSGHRDDCNPSLELKRAVRQSTADAQEVYVCLIPGCIRAPARGRNSSERDRFSCRSAWSD
jgi:hypothetical protein